VCMRCVMGFGYVQSIFCAGAKGYFTRKESTSAKVHKFPCMGDVQVVTSATVQEGAGCAILNRGACGVNISNVP
jgi:hypothetical protein